MDALSHAFIRQRSGALLSNFDSWVPPIVALLCCCCRPPPGTVWARPLLNPITKCLMRGAARMLIYCKQPAERPSVIAAPSPVSAPPHHPIIPTILVPPKQRHKQTVAHMAGGFFLYIVCKKGKRGGIFNVCPGSKVYWG